MAVWDVLGFLFMNVLGFMCMVAVYFICQESQSGNNVPVARPVRPKSVRPRPSRPLESIENITVGTITGHSASIPVAADSTLGDLKLLIAEQLDIPVQAQRLVVASDNRDVDGWLRVLAHRRLRNLMHEHLLVVAVPIDEEDQEDNSPRTTEAPRYKVTTRATLPASFEREARSRAVNNGKKKKKAKKQRAVSEEQVADIVYDDNALVME